MIRRKNSMRKELVGMTLAAVAALALSASSAFALPTPATGTDPFEDVQLLNYFTSPGGAAGTQTNVTDPQEDNGLSGDPALICAMFYVFDSHQLLQECCGCPVTSDGLRTVDNVTDLADEPLFQAAPLATGVIRIVSAEPNGCNSLSPTSSFACTAGGPLVGVCDATGGTYPFGQYHSTFPGVYSGSHTNAGKGLATLSLVENLRAWSTHIQNAALTESEYQQNPLSQNDANSLAEACGDIQSAASGRGPAVCSCGTGD